MVSNVYAKSNYDQLRIDKALGISQNLIATTRTTFVAIGVPSVPKSESSDFPPSPFSTIPLICHSLPVSMPSTSSNALPFPPSLVLNMKSQTLRSLIHLRGHTHNVFVVSKTEEEKVV